MWKYRFKQLFYTLGLIGVTLSCAFTEWTSPFYVALTISMSVIEKILHHICRSPQMPYPTLPTVKIFAHLMMNLISVLTLGIENLAFTSLLSLFMLKEDIPRVFHHLVDKPPSYKDIDETQEEEIKAESILETRQKIATRHLRSEEELLQIATILLNKANLSDVTVKCIPPHSDEFESCDYRACANLVDRVIVLGAGLRDPTLSNSEVIFIIAHEIAHLKYGTYDFILRQLVDIFAVACIPLVSIKLLMMMGNHPAMIALLNKQEFFNNSNLSYISSLFPNRFTFLSALMAGIGTIYRSSIIPFDKFLALFRANVESLCFSTTYIANICVLFFRNGYKCGEETRADIEGTELAIPLISESPINPLQKLKSLMQKPVVLTADNCLKKGMISFLNLYTHIIYDDHPPSVERDAMINEIIVQESEKAPSNHKKWSLLKVD